MRALPLDGRRLVRARHRQAARRLAEPRPERRRDRRARARTSSRSTDAARRRRGDGAQGARELGPGQVRRRAVPRRQGLPARRQDRGDADPAGLRPRRRQPRTPRPAGARCRTGTPSSPTSRCTARATSSTRGSNDPVQFPVAARDRLRATCAATPDLDHAQAARRCSSTSSRSGRRRRRGGSFDAAARAARQGDLQRQGEVRELPRAAALHRARLEPAHAGGDRHRRLPGRPLARPTLPHDAARGPVRATPRAASTTTAASRRSATSSTTTTAASSLGLTRRAAERPGRVPQVAVTGRAMRGPSLRTLSLASAAALAAAYALVFLYAPVDADQGLIQKIFYIHVPLAIVCLCGFVAGAVAGDPVPAHRRPALGPALVRRSSTCRSSSPSACSSRDRSGRAARGATGGCGRADAGLAPHRLPPLLHLPAAALRDRGSRAPGALRRGLRGRGRRLRAAQLHRRAAGPAAHPPARAGGDRRPDAGLDAAHLPGRLAAVALVYVTLWRLEIDLQADLVRAAAPAAPPGGDARRRTAPTGRPSASSWRWPDADRAGGRVRGRRPTSWPAR